MSRSYAGEGRGGRGRGRENRRLDQFRKVRGKVRYACYLYKGAVSCFCVHYLYHNGLLTNTNMSNYLCMWSYRHEYTQTHTFNSSVPLNGMTVA